MEQTKLNEQIAETEPNAEAEIYEGDRAEAVSLKKFKDVESLQNAYKALEAEFTKRCQRLKALEEENRRLMEEAETKQNSSAETAGDENADERYIEEFFERFPEAEALVREISAYAVGGDNFGKKGYMERAYVDYLKDAFEKLKSESLTEEYLLSHIEGTPIKEKIIRDYLAGVRNSNAAPLLIGEGGEIALSPLIRPKNLHEAALLAQKMLKLK